MIKVSLETAEFSRNHRCFIGSRAGESCWFCTLEVLVYFQKCHRKHRCHSRRLDALDHDTKHLVGIMCKSTVLTIPKPRILYTLRLFYMLYLPCASIGLVVSVVLCLPLYRDVFNIPDSTPPIGPSDVESRLMSHDATAIILLIHHILYSVQIVIGLVACKTQRIACWIIYAGFSSINGVLLFTLTMTGLVVMALPVLFSIIDVGTTCCLCFFLDSWQRDSRIFEETIRSKLKTRRRSTKISADDSLYLTVPSALPRINELDNWCMGSRSRADCFGLACDIQAQLDQWRARCTFGGKGKCYF